MELRGRFGKPIAWDELYYGENLPRLKAAEAVYDPLNIYHHRQSIRP